MIESPSFLAHTGEEVLFILAPVAVILGLRYAAARRRQETKAGRAAEASGVEAEERTD